MVEEAVEDIIELVQKMSNRNKLENQNTLAELAVEGRYP